jgi:hypothetical protein
VSDIALFDESEFCIAFNLLCVRVYV